MLKGQKNGFDLSIDSVYRENHTFAIYHNFNSGPDYGNHRLLMIGDDCAYKTAPRILPGDWNGNKDYVFVGFLYP